MPTLPTRRPRSALALAGWLALCYFVAASGAAVTITAIPTWYVSLAKPPLTPPNWLFAPVWTLLYTASAVAAWLAWRTRPSNCRNRGIRLFLVQLLLNLTWSWLFFGSIAPALRSLRSPCFGLPLLSLRGPSSPSAVAPPGSCFLPGLGHLRCLSKLGHLASESLMRAHAPRSALRAFRTKGFPREVDVECSVLRHGFDADPYYGACASAGH